MSLATSFKFLVKSFSNFHSQGDKPNILLVATPRGGSTWVMEIIASQPGMKYYDEPFSVRRENVQKVGLFHDWEDFQPEKKQDDTIIRYINELQSNKHRFMNPPPFRKNHRVFTNRIIFKIHELEHLVNKIEQECNLKVLYLLRHPIPNSLSRRVTPRLNLFMNSDTYCNQYLTQTQMKDIKHIFETGDDLDRKILDWCFENLVPLRFSDRSQWLTISYEELLLNSRKMCELMAKELLLDDLPALFASVDEPAANITMSKKETLTILKDPDEEKRKKNMVTKWRKSVSVEKERQTMQILSLFDLDTYTADRYIANTPFLHFNDTDSIMDNADTEENNSKG